MFRHAIVVFLAPPSSAFHDHGLTFPHLPAARNSPSEVVASRGPPADTATTIGHDDTALYTETESAAAATPRRVGSKIVKKASPVFNTSDSGPRSVYQAVMATGILSLIVLLLFLVLRPLFPEIYLGKSYEPHEWPIYRPDRWLRNMFCLSAEEAFDNGISMDGCAQIIFFDFCFQVFVRLVLLSPLPLCINWFGTGFNCGYQPDSSIPCGIGVDHNGQPVHWFYRLSITQFEQCNRLIWGQIVTVWLMTAILFVQLKAADDIFIALRTRWLLESDDDRVRTSIMVMGTQGVNNDIEFKQLFENVFPGKVRDAKLVKSCPELAKTCAVIDQLQENMALEASKEKRNATLVRMGSAATEILRSFVGRGLHKQLNEKCKERQELYTDLYLSVCNANGEVPAVPVHLEIKRSDSELEAMEKKSGWQKQKMEAATRWMKQKANFVGKNVLRTDVFAAEESPFTTVGFVSFADKKTATMACQLSYSENPFRWCVRQAPDPDDVLWEHISSNRASADQSLWYVSIIGAACVFISWSPAVLAVSSFIQLDNLENLFPAFHSLIQSLPTSVHAFIEGILATLVMKTFMQFLPDVFFYLVVLSGALAYNEALTRMQTWILGFNVVFVLFGNSLGKTLQTLLCVEEIHLSFWQVFGASVPSNFPFLFAYTTLSVSGLMLSLLQISTLKDTAVAYFFRGLPKDVAYTIGRLNSNGRFSNCRRFAMFTLHFAIGIILYPICPIISLFSVVLFAMARSSVRYRVLYMDHGQCDSGGLQWPRCERHLTSIFIIAQIVQAAATSAVLSNLYTLLATIPLPMMCCALLVKLQSKKWEFTAIQHPELNESTMRRSPSNSPARGARRYSKGSFFSINEDEEANAAETDMLYGGYKRVDVSDDAKAVGAKAGAFLYVQPQLRTEDWVETDRFANLYKEEVSSPGFKRFATTSFDLDVHPYRPTMEYP
eukprot:GEMP01001464.1.p1 GENE.GEMP01001464.1~~GEMP01001464.1.p1  ORF type:complete len:948 (+),score=179.83 GEMP01001464.1:228-3071(+)